MRRSLPWSLACWVVLGGVVGTTGCDNARGAYKVTVNDVAAGTFAPECMTCHGEGTNPAPPRALDGATGTKHRGVGAHQIHLGQSAVTLPVACSACHVVPSAIFDPEHLELDPSVDLTKGPARHAEITFSGRALANGATPTWDSDALTCSGTWCHGDADRASGEGGRPIRGGRFSQPMWTLVNGTQRACDACHGAPPPAPHPQSKKCASCHATVVGPDRVIINRALHINGKVDVALSAAPPCGACHGDPPVEKNHPQLKTCETCHATTVGPKFALLVGGAHRDGKVDVVLSAAPPCAGCHGDPPADKHPKFDKCELCHATTVGPNRVLLAGGTHRDGKINFALPANDCTSCHGFPPIKNNHPNMTQCGPCHSKTVAPMGADGSAGELIVGGAHVNGKVDLTLPTGTCSACHGGVDGGPPPDHNGKTDPTLPTVGAHAAHLKGKKSGGGGLACNVCHDLPTSVTETGHLTGELQTVVFPGDTLASYKGTVPSYDPKTQRCSDVYCHGATMQGGQHTSPSWTDTDYGCDACHGNPPPLSSGHGQLKKGEDTKACSQCHTKTVDSNGQLRTDTGAHINGWVDP